LRPGKAPDRFSDKLREGFCLGCGGKTRWVKNHFKRFGKDGDSLNWHRACYKRYHSWWTRDPETDQGYERVCPVCGERFTASGNGAWRKKTCSKKCQYERALEIARIRARIRRSRPLPRHERACVICGKLFPVGGGLGRWKKMTCSRACHLARKHQTTAAWYKAHARPLTIQKCKCAVCGKSFSYMGSKPGLRKTCNIPCRYEWKRRKLAAWEKAHPGRKKKARRRAKQGE